MPQKILITGANRGIGLALATQFLGDGHRVIATARRPRDATQLNALQSEFGDALAIEALDVNSDESVARCAETVRKAHSELDLLVNNAGIFPEDGHESFAEIALQHFRDAFETNVLGVLRTVRAFAPLLEASGNPRIVNLSSGAGSIGEKDDSHYYAYSVSKAALNMLTRALAAELKPRGICVVALSPGWVKTELGGEGAEITPEESAAAIAKTVMRLTLDDTSRFMGRTGSSKGYSW